MADTLGDLKARIRLELNRDDIAEGGESEAALDNSIKRAIDYYSDENFWFNRGSASTLTTAGRNYVVLPYQVSIVETVSYLGSALSKVSVREIEYLTDSGRPCKWAENGDVIQLWPIPDAAYPLTVFGIAKNDPPEEDADESIWTSEAQDLIAARTRFLLFRDVFRDTEGTQLAAQAEGEALSQLRKKNMRRAVTPLRSTRGDPWAATPVFDINRG